MTFIDLILTGLFSGVGTGVGVIIGQKIYADYIDKRYQKINEELRRLKDDIRKGDVKIRLSDDPFGFERDKK